MGTVFLHGRRGGVNPLNFRVLGGTAAPSGPKENDIWVNSDTEITGWVFSVAEPAAPVEGMVWIATGKSGGLEFNALKKNGIQVYPMSAKQYIDGAWVDKTAKSYQGGGWVGWITELYLYNNGEYDPDITGWTCDTGTQLYSSSGEQYVGSSSYCTKPVDLTNYTTLTAEGVASRKGSIRVANEAFSATLAYADFSITERGYVTIDISDINGNCYIGIASESGSMVGSVTCYSIMLS